ncbi:type IV conjugative transfer system coupling protein TraD [Cronobacter sakazakii]|uniref:type IV conjugative transfer system coupling protein TraD n=1 Tax=Cronobacter malonaticus TaxID=413503 RepID=UPI00289404C9|nr:type IV conjugative transfer system coupling protein TraD [Cronobacter malonaticus]MDI7344820.1 type IV conjugative transfer system coupling protein TraD [Cronobacter sakazakii]MDI7511092.1 type IV conjugative transfer system coupling protein TraD [Cronobacter sakazakii]MDI7531682.1 type IV conjugative transfer system coupling protein TraD [Cronobacter sakazakii]MDI7539815.1 type IV conjugative transfer system coupling protein TraD [Cronobacter sakazakii]MDI7552222.1 type IV conjugative tra
MSFAGKYLTQGGQMTAYRWRMFLQVNNWIGFWILILFIGLGAIIFLLKTPQELLENGAWYWFANLNATFADLIPAGKGKFYDIHYFYAPANSTLTLKMTLQQMLTDPYMQVMGERFATNLEVAAIASGTFSLCVFFAITWFITRIGRRESEDEYISGMQLTDKPAEVNRLLRQNGELSDLRVGDLHMVKRAEVMNFLIHGTIGVGKSTLIRWLLDYIRRRGDRAIIYDSGCTFTETHYNPQTDFILNAHDERCANWQMWGECIDTVDYENLAASLIPVEGDSDPFWVSSSRTIFSDLAIRMSADPERSIEKFLMTLLSLSMKSLREYLANTPSANLVEEKIEKTAISIRSVVTNYAKALRYLQGLDDGTKPPFTIREWMTSGRYDNSWLFISTQARHRKSVRPLISMWLSMTTLLLQSMGENSERRVWFIIDEKTSLQRIPEFAETLAEARKFGGCFVIGIQNMAQLIHVYGREMARSIFDLLNTRMYGRSPSAEMAKVVEEDLGNQRRKEAREQNSYGLDQVRDGISIGKDKVNQPVVDYEQIMRLPNLNFYVRLPGEYPVVRLGLKYRAQKKRNAGLMERNIRDALSPELEKVIRENERTAAAAGLNFPTGDEVLEGQPVTPAPEPEIVPDAAKPAAPAVQPRPEKKAAAQPTDKPAAPEQATAEPALASQVSDSVPVAQQPAARTVPAPQEGKTAEPARPTIPQRSDNVVSLRPAATPTAPAADAVKPAVFSRPQPAASRSGVTGSALEMLQRRVRQSDNQNSEEEAPQEGGETMNLDMAVTQLPDGGLQLTTVGNTPDEHSVPANGRAGHRMAQEEENILRHREQGEPGPWVAYDHDFEHDDGEYER